MQIRIGTRKSRLALVQAEMVAARLKAVWPGLATDIVAMSTSGDQLVDRPLSEFGGKGLFTKELEEGLLSDQVDVAVHSIKDMQTTLPDGLTLACALEREDPRDMLVVATDGLRSLRDLSPNTIFGSSSLRRVAQMHMQLPGLPTVPLRGNVETRLRKIEEGEIGATLLAVAGLKRLGLMQKSAWKVHGVILPPEQCLPAVAQGAIGLECRSGDDKTLELLAPLNHAATLAAVTCERAFLKVLDGSCRTPIAGYGEVNDGKIYFRGLLAEPDGSRHWRAENQGDMLDAEGLGREAGELLRRNAS
jgi:hydroxymethylbilane synthase